MDKTATRSPGLERVSLSKENSRAADDLRQLLDRFRRLCKESGEGFSDALTRVAELRERLDEERFHLAVLGQFKRGKSTLLNALLGEPLLPTAVVPLTSIPTFLHAGKTRVVRVFFQTADKPLFPISPGRRRARLSPVTSRRRRTPTTGWVWRASRLSTPRRC